MSNANLSLEDAVSMLGVPSEVVIQQASRGRLAYSGSLESPKFQKADLESWLKNQFSKPLPDAARKALQGKKSSE